jgi:hypothetical protein
VEVARLLLEDSPIDITIHIFLEFLEPLTPRLSDVANPLRAEEII